jgi:NADP-dependent 3-hydroxy acid dehydrogenase YdfG
VLAQQARVQSSDSPSPEYSHTHAHGPYPRARREPETLSSVADISGNVAFVTGASRGIGAATSRLLAQAGVRVALASRKGEDLGLDDALGIACDVSDRQQVEAAVAQTVEKLGGLDILVNNAGVATYGPFLDLAVEDIEEMIDVNLKGTLYATRAALPHLLESDAADIVNLASVAGLRGFPGEAVYCASKFGQLGFGRALDHELRERGVRVTNLCPGGVATDFAIGRGRPEEATAGMMHAEDVAETVLFAVSRPRNHRVLTLSYRPMSEPSAG